MSFPRYANYKDAERGWLPIPAHWDARPLGRCGAFLKGSGGSKADIVEDGLPCIRYGDLYTTHEFFVTHARTKIAPSEAENYTRLQHGDALFAASGETFEDIGRSAVNMINGDAYCGGDVIILRPVDGLHPRFLGYAGDSFDARQQKASMGRGTTVKHIYPDQLRRVLIALPPAEEQIEIANFLDREVAKIDCLVAEQERLIELLTEKRHAVISHAVSKGLNPDVRFRSSGSGWIGDVPEHWTVQRMRSVATMDSGHTPDKKIPEYWNGSLPWVSLNDTAHLKEHDYISDTVNHISQAGLDNSSAHLLPAGAVVFSRDATIGRCAITTRPMAVSQHFIAWICGTRIVPEYLLFRLRSMTQELESMTTGATVKTIGMPEVNTLLTPIPPIEEQEAIVDRVRKLTAMIDSLNTDAEKAVQLLRERRSALISAAVTGQIDVRGLVEDEVA